MRRFWILGAALAVTLLAFEAFAGSSGAPPGGGGNGGGGGAEPGLWAMMLFSAAPCAFFVRRAMRSNRREK